MSETRTLTSDVGFAIRDALELLQEGVFSVGGGEPDRIRHIDTSDPNNLVAFMGSGAQFTIRIVRTG